MRLIVTACTLALVINLSGCSGDAEELYKKQIDLFNQLAEAIEKKDEAKAQSTANELKDLLDKLKEKKVTESEKKRIEEKYKEDLEKAFTRLLTAMMKDPEFAKKIDYKPSK